MNDSTPKISPVDEAEPSFLVHQTTRISEEKARRSQRNGICVNSQKAGEINALRTAQRVAQTAMAVTSWLPRPLMGGNTFLQKRSAVSLNETLTIVMNYAAR